MMTTFAVKNLMCRSYITNEVLDIIATQIISEEEGLASVIMSDFKHNCGPFDESLLERIAHSCIKLQKLEVSDMDQLSSDSR